ncbi:unnamed protein product, partial [Ectocarpus fasciculatus]
PRSLLRERDLASVCASSQGPCGVQAQRERRKHRQTCTRRESAAAGLPVRLPQLSCLPHASGRALVLRRGTQERARGEATLCLSGRDSRPAEDTHPNNSSSNSSSSRSNINNSSTDQQQQDPAARGKGKPLRRRPHPKPLRPGQVERERCMGEEGHRRASSSSSSSIGAVLPPRTSSTAKLKGKEAPG